MISNRRLCLELMIFCMAPLNRMHLIVRGLIGLKLYTSQTTDILQCITHSISIPPRLNAE